MGILVRWVKVLGLTVTTLFVVASCMSVFAAEEEDPAFKNLRKGPDGLYHLEEEGVEESVATARGQSQFNKYCASCHGTDGKGNGPVAMSLKEKPADLTQIAKKNGGEFPLQETYQMVDGRKAVSAHGSREMPVWGEELIEPTSAKSSKPDRLIAVEKRQAESKVRDRITELVLYIQSIQGG